MKAEELMIGDILRVNRDGICITKDTIVQVRGIDADNKFKFGELVGSATCHPLDNSQFDGGIWFDYLDPIPLTPEILEKNGFKRKQKTFEYFEYKERGLDIEIEYFESCICMDIEWNVPGSWGYNRLHSITIENVHELQHALRLCGIEKEIVI